MHGTLIEYGSRKRLPGDGPAQQVFVIGDIHGQAEILRAILEKVRDAPRTASQSHLVFLGDVIDRGPASLAAIDLVLSAQDLAQVDQVTFLPGNHELMLLDGLRDPDRYIGDWLDNGGDALLREAFPDHKETKLLDFAKLTRSAVPPAFLDLIEPAPSHLRLGDLLFVHAGIDPAEDQTAFLAQSGEAVLHDSHWAWIRDPFLNHTGGWDPEGKQVVIHGHTPVVDRLAPLSEIMKAADLVEQHRRICLDAGAAVVPQIAWLELDQRTYRYAVTRSASMRCPNTHSSHLEQCFEVTDKRATLSGRGL